MQRQLWALLAFCFLAARSFAAITGIVMTADGQPVAGARVSIRAFETVDAARTRILSASPEAVPISTAQTDSKGAFSLESPKEPVVELSVYARGYDPHQRRIERDEELGAIVLQKSEIRKGSVTAGGKPVAGAKVVVSYGGYEYLTRTDEQGRYEAPDVKRSQSIAVVHPDYAIDYQTFLPMIGNSPTAGTPQRTLSAGSAFQGRAVSGEKDAPVAGATIQVDGWPVTTSGEDGTFTIAHMPPKWKTLTARKDTLLGQRAFSKEATGTIQLAKAATISGRITDAKTHVPIGGVVVRAGTRRPGPNTDSTVAVTDAKGAYSLLVPAGTYMVLASHPAYEFKPADASTAAGQQTTKDIALAPLARVSGVVLDESKKPVVVAVVDTEDADTGRMGMPPMRMMRGADSIVSGPDGRFSMRIQPDQDLYVRAKKRGLPPAKSESVHLAAGERKTGIVLTIPSGIAVSGRAIDAQGQPLSGVAVTANEAEGGQRGMMIRAMIGGNSGAEEDAVRTGSDGTFTMRVKEGTYDFAFRREGLAPKTVRGQTISVTSSPAIEATMEPAVEIAGRVTRGGAGLENVMVMAMAPGSEPFTSTTAADGSFTLTGLAPGSVRLMARKPDDFVQETRNVDAPARDVVIDIRPGGRVTGRVVDKDTGKPIPSFAAGISTSRQGGGMVMMAPPQLRSFTAGDGSFTLENVPPGATVLVASAPGYASARLNLTVEEGKETTGVELQLDPGVKLTGRVTSATGTPLSDVQVRVVASPTGGFSMSGSEKATSTDSNGDYTIEGLEAGDESISFSHAKYSSTRKSVNLKGRETRLDVQLASGGRVTGTVVTESGAPVADAQVEAAGNTMQRARTNANGAFEFESVTPGRYEFRASKTGLAEGVLEDVDVSVGTPIQIVMKTGGSIYGRVTGLTAQELEQTRVSASSGPSSAEAMVSANGTYRIEGVAGGTVRVQAWSGVGMSGTSKRSASQTVELAPGGSQQLDITFRNDVVVRGRVTRNGTPLAGGTVNFFTRGGSRGSGSAPTDNDGQYSVTGLEEGDYTVMVNDAQRMSPYSTTYQVRGSATFDIDYKNGALRGRVIDVSSNEPLANATVTLRNTSTTSESFRMSRGAVTDTNGVFLLDSISPGNYSVTAKKDGYSNDVKDLYVGDTAPPDLELRLARNPGVSLTVVDARDGRTITARGVAFDMQGRVADETRMMFGGGDDAGTVDLSLAPGTYLATITASGYAARSITVQSPSTQTVALSPGGTLLLRSKHNEEVRVRLIDANGRPYPRMSALLPSHMLVPAPGTTSLPNLAPGAYTLQLLQGEVVVDSKRVVIGEGQTVTEEI
jgi:protocatechuate 3,4-dioxygenase beta subunit